MRIVSLKAENFRRLHLLEPFELPLGLTIIRGRNEAGKSTIIEAILYGLYGDHNIPGELRGGERLGLGAIVNHGARRAKIEVVFEVGGKHYRVERILEREGESARQIDASLVELSDGKVRLLARGATRVSEMVQKLIRVSWREMLVTNVIAQKDLERIINKGKSDRERVINMLMGFESYNKALEKLGEELREQRRRLEGARRERDELSRRVSELEEKGRRLEEWIATLKELEARIQQLEVEAAREEAVYKYLSELEEVLRRKSELQRSISRVREELATAHESLARVEARLKELTDELERLKREKPLLSRMSDEAREEASRAEQELRALNEARRRVEELRANRSSLLRELEAVRGRISGLSERLERRVVLARKREEVEGELNALRKAAASVKLPAWSVFGSLVVALLSLLAALILHPLFLAGLSGAAVVLLLGLQSKYRRLHGIAEKTNQVKGELSKIEAELQLLERDAGELKGLAEREKLISAQLDKIDAQLSELANQMGIEPRLEAVIASLEARMGEVERRRGEALKRVSKLEWELSKLEAIIGERGRERERLEKELGELRAKIAHSNQEVKELEEEYARLRIPEPPIDVAGLPTPLDERSLGLVLELMRKQAERYSRVREELGKAKGKADELNKTIEETKRELLQLPELKRRLEELTKETASLELGVNAMEIAVDALRRVAEKRRAAFAPSVESNMSWIVSYITNGRYRAVKIDPQSYDVEVYDSEAGRWMRRDIYSGGTNDQFLLAMRIAFTLSLLPAAKGTYPRFLFLDEPLGSSDSERRDLIVKLLSEELTRFFDQVFLVTHVEIDEPPGSELIVIEDGRVKEKARASPEEST